MRDGPVIDLCFQRVPEPPVEPQRLHLDLRGGEDQQLVVERLLARDASLEPSDDADAVAREIGERGGRELHFAWGDLPWRHFADPSGNELCVLPSY